MDDGLCIEMLHIGSYDDEPETFAKMAQYANDNGLTRKGCCHREIYLNNANIVGKSKLKTIIRYAVE